LNNNKRKKDYFLYLLLFIFTAFFSYSVLVDFPQRQWHGFFSDEAAYYSIIQSIAHDFDVEYTEKDIYRIKKDFGIPQGIFLKKGKDGKIYFSKSFIYPLCASMFYKFFNVNGIFIFHSLLLLLILYFGYLLGKKYYKQNTAIVYILLFVFGSIACVYFFWITADFFNFSVVFLSYLIFFYYKEKNSLYPIITSSFLLGVAAFSKPPNLFLVLPLLYIIVFRKKSFKKFVVFSLFFILPVLLLFGSYYLSTGDWNYMGGERKSFYNRFPLEQKNYTFENIGIKMSSSNYWDRYFITPKIFFLNFIYFFVGRYTGTFIYLLPGMIFLLIFLFRREKNLLKYLIIITFFIEVFFHIIVIPDNYFGGAGSLGNRYALNFYPLLFFLFPLKIDLKKLYITGIASLILLVPALVDPLFYSTYAGELSKTPVLNKFPPELTQIKSIPTNTNPYAFGKKLINSNIYILNNNFHKVREDRGLFIRSEGKIEFVLETFDKYRNLELKLRNNPSKKTNKVKIKIGSKKKKLTLESDEGRDVYLKGLKPSLYMKGRYYYYGKITTTTSSIPFFLKKDSDDRRRISLYFKPVFE